MTTAGAPLTSGIMSRTRAAMEGGGLRVAFIVGPFGCASRGWDAAGPMGVTWGRGGQV
jgi:hypothetical protein